MPQAVQLPKLVALGHAVGLLAVRHWALSAKDRRNLLIAGIHDGSVRYTNIVFDATVRIRPNELSCSFTKVGEAYELPPHFWDGKISWSNSCLLAHPPPPVEGEFWITRGYLIFVDQEDVLSLREQLVATASASTDPQTHQILSSTRPTSSAVVIGGGVTEQRRKRGAPRKFTVEEALEMIPRIAAESPWVVRKLSDLVQAVQKRLSEQQRYVSKATIRKCVRSAIGNPPHSV